MDSSPSPIPAISDIFEGGKQNFAKSFELSIKKASQLFFNVSRNVQTLKNGNDNAAAPAATGVAPAAFPPSEVDAREQPALTITEPSTSNEISAEEAAAAAPGRANVSALMFKTWGKGRVGAWKLSSAGASSISLSSSSSLTPSEPSPSPNSSSSAEDEIPSPHFDLSTVSATSVFDIGSIGTPVLGSPEVGNERGGTVVDDDFWKAAAAPPSRFESESPQNVQQQPSPLVELDDVRKFVGNAIVVWRKVRALGLRESSWENKMPWRHPRPAYLAKGLQRPPEEFSSEKEKHEYYRRARRRGRYLIGAIPTWSFIVADLALLYFLIDNPAGKFLL